MHVNAHFVCNNKKVVDGHRKQLPNCFSMLQIVLNCPNGSDCFKLSKWSDESPLMARPLRLLFYLGPPLSIQTALPMHKAHNAIQYNFLVILYILYYLPTILFSKFHTVSNMRCTTQSSQHIFIYIFSAFFCFLVYPSQWDVPHSRAVSTSFHIFSGSLWRLPMHTHPDSKLPRTKFWNCAKRLQHPCIILWFLGSVSALVSIARSALCVW